MDLANFLILPDRGADIFESLLKSTRDDRAYTIRDPQWPAVVTVAPGSVTVMPGKVVEEGENAKVVCRLGMFPQVDLGWASVDSKFFLWKFGTCGAVLVEKEMPEIISCVGVAKPRPRVFTETIKNILVVCTSTEVVLLGLTLDEKVTSAEIQNLTFYSCSLDGRMIHTITSSENGRIFLGGLDGVILEVLYSTGAGILWSSPLCQKVVVNGSFLSMFLKPKEEDRITQLLIDDQRNILYSLDAAGRIQAYDLGSKGLGHPKNSASCNDFWASASRAISGRDCFSTLTERRVVSISVEGHSHSRRICLMAMTSDGHRVFFGSQRPEKQDWLSTFSSKPQLRAVVVRPAPRVESFMGAAGRTDVLLDRENYVDTSVNCRGGVIMAVSSDGNAPTTEIMGFFNSPGTAASLSEANQTAGIEEELVMRAFAVEGSAISLDEIHVKPSRHSVGRAKNYYDELSAQVHESPRAFGLVTTHCSVVFRKKWPVNILAEILEADNLDVVRSFFKSYGPENAAAMCFQLATGCDRETHAVVVRASTKILTDPGFGGEPQVLSPEANSHAGVQSSLTEIFETSCGPIRCSAAFYGLRIYIARLLEPIWRDHLFKETTKSKLLQCSWTPEEIEWYGKRCQEAMNAASALLSRWNGQKVQNGLFTATSSLCKQFETKLVQTARCLLKRVSDVMGLMKVLLNQSVTRIMARLPPDQIKNLQKLKLMGLVVEIELPGALDALLAEMTSDEREWSDAIIDQLSREASSFFDKDKKIYFKAFQKLQRAVLLGKSDKQQQKNISDALHHMKQVPREIDVPLVAEPLYNIGNIEDFVSICLFAALSPGSHEIGPTNEIDSDRTWQRRNACYNLIFRAVDNLLIESQSEGAHGEAREKLNRVLKAAIVSKDQDFLRDLFERVCKDRTGGAYLIQLDSPEISKFLHTMADLRGRSPVLDMLGEEKVHYVMLLAQLYSKQGSYEESADLYKRLALRRSEYGQTSIPLTERVHLLRQAQNQLSCINIENEEINQMLLLASLQQRILHRIELSGAHVDLKPLKSEIVSLGSLIDDYAVPHKLYDFSLEALSLIKEKTPSKQVQGLWDRLLRTAWEDHGSVVDVCDYIKSMGNRSMRKPVRVTSAKICSILEAMGLGIWPENQGVRRPTQEEKQAIQETLYIVFGSWPCVLDAYLTCLEEQKSGYPSSRHPPQLAVEVLNSLLAVFRRLCCDTFADTEVVSSRGLIRQLDSCLRMARNFRIASLQTEVAGLVGELESIKKLVSSRTQLMR